MWFVLSNGTLKSVRARGLRFVLPLSLCLSLVPRDTDIQDQLLLNSSFFAMRVHIWCLYMRDETFSVADS